MKRTLLKISACLVCVAVFQLAGPQAAAASRFNKTLDDGVSVVVVDNYSSWSDTHAGNLALAADRSTKDDGMLHRARRGLFPAGSRVFVNNNYLAWFAASHLGGVWSLNPATGEFLHKRTGPNGFTDWSHNEFVMGSASPQQQTWAWDTNSPGGIEHSIVYGNLVTGPVALFSHLGGYLDTAHGNFQVLYDGAVNPLGVTGVVYTSSSRLATNYFTDNPNDPFRVDISDGNDLNGVQNYVESEVAYICRDTDIKVVWRLKPSAAATTPSRTFYHVWANYSFDVDACSPAPGNISPDQVWGQPAYFQSSLSTFSNSYTPPKSAGSINPLPTGTPCGGNNGFSYAANPAHNDWVRMGESSSLAAGTPRWTLTHQVDALWGTPFALSYLGFGNEDTDGVWGLGGVRDGATFAAGVWHTVSYLLGSK